MRGNVKSKTPRQSAATASLAFHPDPLKQMGIPGSIVKPPALCKPMQTVKAPPEWRCDTCQAVYSSERDASLCETRHKEVIARHAAYHAALANGKPLVGMFREGKDAQFVLYAVVAILGKAEPRNIQSNNWRNVEDEARYRFSDACNAWDDFLFEGKYRRYLSIQEAVEAGWCPFFSQHYQTTFPLAMREQIADAFLALPEDAQREHLVSRKAMLRSHNED